MYYFPIVQAPDENWTLGSGRITPQMIESFMPPKSKNKNNKISLVNKIYCIDRDDSIVLVCGSNILKAEVLDVFK